ncbi:histidine phosphatase family protein [Solwaraspora sp. WMMD406]|uniref:histidine phosphatase family protein n=1 Tax=Solwaraspora sp. WMMD406 TaxID=3016095 RepID=UPI002415E9BC|nr:histidine phosphatase family protein [Solwaraspora sp. WMMD406]MDG4765251.1 histidine phosphatase family protein [Solwaraspora sp. WMMD406]
MATDERRRPLADARPPGRDEQPAAAHLVRHGWTDWDAAGPTELAPLTEAGIDRMRAAAARLRPACPVRVVTSPVTRALHSAHIVATDLNLPLLVEPDLREWQADRDGRPVDRAAFGRALESLHRPGGPGTPPWETVSELRARVCAVLHRYRDASTVFVSHGVALHAVAGRELPPGGLLTVAAADLPDGTSGAALPDESTGRHPGSPVNAMLRRLLDSQRERPAAAHVAGIMLPAPVRVATVDRALRDLAAADDLLRSQFSRSPAGYRGSQLDDPDVACAVVTGDVPPATHLRAQAAQPIDPYGWPLIRVTLVPGDPALLCLAASPVIADRRSVWAMLADLGQRYWTYADRGDTRPAAGPGGIDRGDAGPGGIDRGDAGPAAGSADGVGRPVQHTRVGQVGQAGQPDPPVVAELAKPGIE